MEEGQNQSSGWQFNPQDNPTDVVDGAELDAQETVRWTASEYVAHHKSLSWFMLLGLATVIFAVIVYLITGGDVLSAVMVCIAGIIFGVFGARRPQVLEYSVGVDGVTIASKYYGWSEFKSFALLDEGVIHSILLLPLKRLMPSISIYYAPEDEGKIMNILATYLPIEQRQQDPLERLMHKMRF